MKLNARFLTSATCLADCPRWDTPEIAFAGRSNAGKSSLINALTGVKGLARTSKSLGRTRTLNFFIIGDDQAWVDLPGYGYARTSEAEARKIASMMQEYLERRRNLIGLVMVIDARRAPEDEELMLARAITSRGRKLLVAATKCDKLNRQQKTEALKRLTPTATDVIVCSATHDEGLDAIRQRLFEWARDKPEGRHSHRAAARS